MTTGGLKHSSTEARESFIFWGFVRPSEKMAMSNGIRVGSITIGCSLLVLTFLSMICGIVAMSKMSTPVARASIGLWGLYFAIPGVFSVLAGYKKQSTLLAVALGTHVLGIVLAIVGLYFGASFWAILASNCADSYDLYDGDYRPSYRRIRTVKRDGYCSCFYHDDMYEYT
ncbi:---NA---, partial [Paramuricea clavata]